MIQMAELGVLHSRRRGANGKSFSAVLKFGIPPLSVSAFSRKLLAFRGSEKSLFGHFPEKDEKLFSQRR